jgi:hypothetical protein
MANVVKKHSVASELAALVASEGALWSTGADIPVDGGSKP